MGVIKRYKSIFSTINKFSKAYTVLTITIKLLALSNVYLIMYMNKLIINELSGCILFGNTSLLSISFRLVAYSSIEIIVTLLFNIMQYHLGKLKLKYDDNVFVEVRESIIKLDMAYYDDPEPYNQTKYASKYVTSILESHNLAIEFMFSIISLIVAMCFSLEFSIIITLLSVLSTIPNLTIRRKMKNELHLFDKTIMDRQRYIEYLGGFFLNKNVVMEMQLYGFAPYIIMQIKKAQLGLRDLRIRFSVKNARKEFLLTIINKMILLAQQLYMIIVIVKRGMTIGDYTYYWGIINNLSGAIGNISKNLSEASILETRYQELIDILNRKEHIYTNGQQEVKESDNFDIVFENVSFKYPNSDSYTLSNISFTIHAGEKVAIIGRNGAGKTTLVKLLLRFYDPTEGRILLNNIDIREYELSSYRRVFSAMFQELLIYLLPIRDNVMLSEVSRMDNSNSNNKAEKILYDLGFNGIDDDNIDLDRSYGKEFCSNGYVFSKGQQQRIQAARTLFHEGKIYIFDEPAASLDAVSENKLLEILEEYSSKKTVIYITHRYNNMYKMDNIILLDEGRVMGMDCHSALLMRSELYAHLFSMQNHNNEYGL